MAEGKSENLEKILAKGAIKRKTKMENLTKKLSLVKNQKGFSLIEWIITGAICSILTTIAA